MSTAELVTKPGVDAVQTSHFRSQIAHISRQSSVFFAGTIFTAAAGYLFKIYLARVLGAEALGVYALGMTIVGFLGIFNALGLPQSAVRFVAEYSATSQFALLRGFLARSLAWLALANVVLGFLVLIAGPWIGVHLYHTTALRTYMVLFAAIMLFGAINTFLGQALAGYRDVGRRTVITNFVGSPLTMLFTLLFVTVGWGLWGYIFAQVAAAAVVMSLLAAAVWKLTPKPARSSSGFAPLQRQVVSFSTIAFGVAFLEFVMAQADKIIIGFYLTASEVGIYALAAALVAFIPIVLQSVNQIFSPTIAELHARDQHLLLKKLYQTLTKWIIGFTIPLAALMIVFAPALMKLFGKDFAASWPVLVIGAIGQLVNCSVGSVGYLLLMSGHQKKLIRIQAISGLVMIVLSLLLVPAWGIVGAAVGAAVTNAFTNIVCLAQVRKTLKMFPYGRSYVRLVPASLASIALLLALRTGLNGRVSDWLAIAVGLFLSYAVFIGFSLMFGLDADDRMIADAILAKLGFCGLECLRAS